MSHDIDAELVRKLAGLLDETGLGEIEFAQGDWRIRVARGSPAPAFQAAAYAPPADGPSPTAPSPGPDMAGSVKSPMVGTAYLAPDPQSRPFVSEGDRVAEGQTLLIVEAMKVMNPIPAPRAGVVRRILIENGQPVEFGQALMVIE